MSSSKLIIVLMALVAILAAFMYYLFSNSKPKDISFYDKNDTVTEQTLPQANVANEIAQQNEPKTAQNGTSQKASAPKGASSKTPRAKTAQNSGASAKNTKNAAGAVNSQSTATQESLRAEYNALMQRAKRDKSMGEPRYSVFVLDSARLNAKEKAIINDITTTLSRRGGYLHYALFVEKLNESNVRVFLYNESLLDEQQWLSRGLNLPNLWFKFNQNSMQSVKNSFHINTLKQNIGKNKIRAIEMSGHTDEIGGEFYNYALGLKRSAAVASEFLRQSGKITLQSFGKDKPVSTGLSERERYKNRRVEVVFE